MTIKTNIEISPSHGRLKIAGRFDLHVHQAFLNASRKLLAECRTGEVVVEMADVTYMDSSALGMLLVLRQEAEQRSITVSLSHCSPFILHILHTAQFDRLFGTARN